MADGEWPREAPDCSLVCYGLAFGVRFGDLGLGAAGYKP